MFSAVPDKFQEEVESINNTDARFVQPENAESPMVVISVQSDKSTQTEMDGLFSNADFIVPISGFKSVEIYGDFDFSPYNEKARTMVIVARK